jgi:hypothetical protein
MGNEGSVKEILAHGQAGDRGFGLEATSLQEGCWQSGFFA